MYPMVQNQQRKKQQQQQQQHHQQQQQQQQQRQRQEEREQDLEDIEQQDEGSTQIRHRSHRPLYRRFISYVREAWTGVKFALGKTR